MFYDLFAGEVLGKHRHEVLGYAEQCQMGFDIVGAATSVDSNVDSSIMHQVDNAPEQAVQPQSQSLLATSWKPINRINILARESLDLIGICNACQGAELLSLEPMDEKSFLLACSTLKVDVLTFNVSDPLPFVLRIPPLKKAVERGMYIELQIGGVMEPKALSHAVAAVTPLLGRALPPRCLILSSGRSRAAATGPDALTALARIIGLSGSEAYSALTSAPKQAMAAAYQRRNPGTAVLQ